MITLANAIKNINPNAEFRIIEPTIDDINTAEKEKADKEAEDNLKASARAKLMSGEALTEEEANTIVL